jgi:hypothetical protein
MSRNARRRSAPDLYCPDAEPTFELTTAAGVQRDRKKMSDVAAQPPSRRLSTDFQCVGSDSTTSMNRVGEQPGIR